VSTDIQKELWQLLVRCIEKCVSAGAKVTHINSDLKSYCDDEVVFEDGTVLRSDDRFLVRDVRNRLQIYVPRDPFVAAGFDSVAMLLEARQLSQEIDS
jgi:hypothetical protein